MKWGGLALTALLCVAWLLSRWWDVCYAHASGWAVQVGGNTIGAMTAENTGAPYWPAQGWYVRDVNWPVRWWVYFNRAGREWVLAIPLWMPTLLTATVTAVAWRLDALARRKVRAGMCTQCGYSLAGLKAGAVCPECGAAR